MGVEGGMKCVKFLLFFFNFIFWLCGLALVVVGVLMQVKLHNTLNIKDPSASGAPIVVIIVGVIIFFIAFFGCCGAWKEHYCMVTTFAVLVFMIIIIEVAAAIAGYVYRKKLSVVVEDSLADMIHEYKNSTEDFRKMVDKLQEDGKCCGSNSSMDWRAFGPDGDSVPDSCCVKVVLLCGAGAMRNCHRKCTRRAAMTCW
ncbi:CD63 antigen [Dissostichus eleginoides]|uniref:Tetraspanin n=1 Tax=Dissostichus eleginoides TaxID=100907 RepID=A0AAD9CD25_DISEL|nr:CD63 antigen [Dissostichus eleginoides]